MSAAYTDFLSAKVAIAESNGFDNERRPAQEAIEVADEMLPGAWEPLRVAHQIEIAHAHSTVCAFFSTNCSQPKRSKTV